MPLIRFLTTAAAVVFMSTTSVFAQTPQPARPAAPAPASPAPAAPARPAAPAAAAPTAVAPAARKINLNTATATELDTLPQIGPARAKAIVDARAKGPFKNWDDFVARKVVPSNAEAAIKDLVGF